MVKHLVRNIDVWKGERVLIEREGGTLSIQVALPRRPGVPDMEPVAMVIDIGAAIELCAMLPEATAILAEVVKEPDVNLMSRPGWSSGT